VFADHTEPAQTSSPPADAHDRPTLIGTVNALRAGDRAGRLAPWTSDLLGDLHRALEGRVDERITLVSRELAAPQWERRLDALRAAALLMRD
jgi:hypothetical protein